MRRLLPGEILRRARRIFRYIFLRLIRVSGDPTHVGLGFALGVFLGIFPTFGLGIPVGILLASLLRWNRAAALLGTLVMNPITTPFFWSLSATVGALIFRADARRALHAAQDGERIWSFTEGALIYLAGNTVVALAGAGIAYFVAVRAIVVYRKKKHERWRRRHPLEG